MAACSRERKYFVDSARDETHHRGGGDKGEFNSISPRPLRSVVTIMDMPFVSKIAQRCQPVSKNV